MNKSKEQLYVTFQPEPEEAEAFSHFLMREAGHSTCENGVWHIPVENAQEALHLGMNWADPNILPELKAGRVKPFEGL